MAKCIVAREGLDKGTSRVAQILYGGFGRPRYNDLAVELSPLRDGVLYIQRKFPPPFFFNILSKEEGLLPT